MTEQFFDAHCMDVLRDGGQIAGYTVYKPGKRGCVILHNKGGREGGHEFWMEKVHQVKKGHQKW